MEEPTLQSDIAPTIIDLDSPDGQEDLSDQNHTEAQMIDESKEKEKEREKENSPQMIDLDPSGQDLSPDFQKDPCLSPQSKNDNENEANRDSDMRNVRSERKSNTAHSPHRQHDEGESMGKERPDSTKEITGSNKPDMWGQDTTNNNDRRVRRSSDSWGQQPVDRVHKSNERGQPVDRVHRSGDSPNERRPHRSHRNRSRSRSWSRSPSGPRRTDWRSPVDRRAPAPPPAWENNRRPPVGPQPCRDFMAGRCRRGPQCRFGHSRERERERDGRDRERERERHPVRGEREFKEEVFEMRGQSEYSRQQGRKGNFEEGGYGYDGRERERCFDFTRGRCKRGADCRFVHDEPAGSNVRERDERESNRDRDRDRDERESYRGGGSNYDEREGANRESDLSYEREREGRRGKKEEICKFFLEGRCGRGTSCRFSHDVAHQVHEDENDMNESSWSSQRESGPRNNQYIVPVTETQNQYNTPLPVPVPVPPVVNNPYMGVNPNPNPNLQGYNNIQSIPVPNLNQMTQPSLPPPPVNPPLPPPPPGKPPNANPNPSNLMTSEQAANITDFSAFVSQILATNNSTVPVPVPVPEPAQSDLHESPITPPVETETLEMKKEDGSKPNPNPNLKGGKESKGLKLFKCALVEVVKDLLKPTWKDGQLSREVHKTIVKKVVDKVVGTVENLPQSQEKIDVYLSHSKPKLMKLVQAYVEKYVKA